MTTEQEQKANADVMSGICPEALTLCTAGERVRCQRSRGHEGQHTYDGVWGETSVGMHWEKLGAV